MQKIDFSHYYDWHNVPDALIGNVMAEFADNGVSNIVLCNKWFERFLKEPMFFTQIRTQMRRFNLKTTDAHAPFGAIFDLNCSEKSQQSFMLKSQKQSIAYATEAGCKVFTIHVGAYDCFFRDTTLEEMRYFADVALEKLLVEAEKNNIVIAVENSFEPFNTPHEVKRLVDKFLCKNLGICYDSGHANMMGKAVGKTREGYPTRLRNVWKDNFPFEEDALGLLAENIVTCHLHDNDGYEDLHDLPGSGTINWEELINRIKKSPRLMTMQSEVATELHCVSIAKLCKTFNQILN